MIAQKHNLKGFSHVFKNLEAEKTKELIASLSIYQQELYSCLCTIKPLQTLGAYYQKLKIL